MAVNVAAHPKSQGVARAIECERLRWNEQRLIPVQLRSVQLNVRRNQIVAAELKRDLLQKARRLKLGTAIGKALDRLGIEFFVSRRCPACNNSNSICFTSKATWL